MAMGRSFDRHFHRYLDGHRRALHTRDIRFRSVEGQSQHPFKGHWPGLPKQVRKGQKG